MLLKVEILIIRRIPRRGKPGVSQGRLPRSTKPAWRIR